MITVFPSSFQYDQPYTRHDQVHVAVIVDIVSYFPFKCEPKFRMCCFQIGIDVSVQIVRAAV